MHTHTSKFSNGDKLRDKVTGLKGIVQVVAFYATGCTHYGIQEQTVKDGKTPDWEWFDESRVEMVKPKAVKFATKERKPSGPCPAGPQL